MSDPRPASRPPAIPMSDESRLLAALAAGDRTALADFVEHTHLPVFRMACRWTRDPEERRDWTHVVLVRILEDLERGRFALRRPGGFWAWFRKRAHYLLLDEYRRSRRVASIEQPAPGGELPAAPAGTGSGSDPARELERVELRAALEHCLERLPSADQRRALTMVLEQELSYQDIAEVMGAPLNTVRAWIHRARTAMRRCLMQRWEMEGVS
jgi:RNA polymerase sigma-70 factor (ECF subfamily)